MSPHKCKNHPRQFMMYKQIFLLQRIYKIVVTVVDVYISPYRKVMHEMIPIPILL